MTNEVGVIEGHLYELPDWEYKGCLMLILGWLFSIKYGCFVCGTRSAREVPCCIR